MITSLFFQFFWQQTCLLSHLVFVVQCLCLINIFLLAALGAAAKKDDECVTILSTRTGFNSCYGQLQTQSKRPPKRNSAVDNQEDFSHRLVTGNGPQPCLLSGPSLFSKHESTLLTIRSVASSSCCKYIALSRVAGFHPTLKPGDTLSR